MNIYKIYTIDSSYGWIGNISYYKDYNKAMDIFNSLKNNIANSCDTIVNNNRFLKEIERFCNFYADVQIVKKDYPYFIYRNNNKLKATIFIHDLEENRTVRNTIVLEKINVID